MSNRDAQALLREDARARARSLDVSGSFLVQAPAGSGKTELLIQRYLALLGRVETPERVLALTFTRKAAGEMRERVGRALFEAKTCAPVADDHQRQTRKLADAVRLQDAKHGWNLLENASRLQMLTYDALGHWLARRAPMATRLGPQPRYVDEAGSLYLAAARAAIAAAAVDDVRWRALLVHLDNNAEQIAKLMAGLLAKRDQWLRLMTGQKVESLRADMKQALRFEVEHILTRVRAGIPPDVASAVADCAGHAARELLADPDRQEFGKRLERLAGVGKLPAASFEAVPQWQALADFLLVKGPQFREKIDISLGFPPPDKRDKSAIRAARKAAMVALRDDFAAVPGLAAALDSVRRLPATELADDSWQIVEALMHVLWLASGELALVFAGKGEIDYVQGTIAAIDALGGPDEPSELLLQLDARIDHLLIDEFQDTSLAQLELLRRLTAGWQRDDGRTLFAVGDPMQSIYRFREAEVRLFVEAQQRGEVAGVPVESLQLRRNFRSQPALVGWVNRAFPKVLGETNDALRGAVAFEPAVSGRDLSPLDEASVDLCASDAEEAAKVVERIGEAVDAGSDDIAILVRARSHLAALLPVLRRAGTPIAAVELDRLSDRQSVRDLVALTHALMQPDDHAAWYGVLRAPWCGLALADLVALAQCARREQCAPAALLCEPGRLPAPDAEAGARLDRAMAALRPALAARGRATLTARVRGAWLALGGPACFDEALDLDAAECYFALLAQHESAGEVPDWDAFIVRLDEIRATPEVREAKGVKVMTMHKAKGLEFDTVILPGLGRGGGRHEQALVTWRRRDLGLLIAPAKPSGGTADAVYDFIADLEKSEDDAEIGRLLYVACTRAKSRLHLIAAPGVKHDKQTGATSWQPAARSSIRKLWPALEPPAPPAAAALPSAWPVGHPPLLERLPLDWAAPAADPGLAAAAFTEVVESTAPPFEWAAETARRVGTFTHRLLARIGSDGIDAWPPERVAALGPRVRSMLTSVGFGEGELHGVSGKVLEAVRRTLADPRGRWIFDATHEDARSEWALSGVDGGTIVHVIVDRTFVADGVRWIVDFKTSTHEGGAIDAFLDSEVRRYRDQLARYGRLMHGLDERPVRLGLYFPLIEGGFREIDGTGSVATAAPQAKASRS